MSQTLFFHTFKLICLQKISIVALKPKSLSQTAKQQNKINESTLDTRRLSEDKNCLKKEVVLDLDRNADA